MTTFSLWIFEMNPPWQSFKLAVTSSTTIHEVKQRIQDKTNITLRHQRLDYGINQDIKNESTLATCGVNSDCSFVLRDGSKSAPVRGTSNGDFFNPLKREGNSDVEKPNPKVSRSEPMTTPSGATSISCSFGSSAVPSSPSSNISPSSNSFSRIEPSTSSSSLPTPKGPLNPLHSSSTKPTAPQTSDPIQPVKVAAKESNSNYRPPSVSSDIHADIPSPKPPIALPPRSSSTATQSPPSAKLNGVTQPKSTSTTESWGSNSRFTFTQAKELFPNYPSYSSGSNQTASNSSSTATPVTSASTLFQGNSTTQAPISNMFGPLSSTAPSNPTVTTQAPLSGLVGSWSCTAPSNHTITAKAPVSNIFGSSLSSTAPSNPAKAPVYNIFGSALSSAAPSKPTVTAQAPVWKSLAPVPPPAPPNPTVTKTNPPTPQKALSAKMDANRALGLAYQKYSVALNNKSSMVGEIAKAEKALSSAKATAVEKDKLLREAEGELNQAWKVFEEKKV